jgi:membrane protease YdiL (CAAX protease family)
VPLAVTFAAIGLNTAFGAPVPDIAEFSVWYGLPMSIAINMVNPLNAQLPEEASFRGWAQPKLQTTRTPLAATVLMAIGVTIWHIPLVVMPQFGSSPIETLATIAVTCWYAWLFNHASGSSLLTLIAHATNGTIETSTLWPAGADTTRMFGSARWSGVLWPSDCWSSTGACGLSRRDRSMISIVLMLGLSRRCDCTCDGCSATAVPGLTDLLLHLSRATLDASIG